MGAHGTTGSGTVGRGLQSEDAVVVFARSCGSVCNKPPTHTEGPQIWGFRLKRKKKKLWFSMFVVHQNGGVQSHTKRLRIPGKPQLVPQVLNLYGVRRVRGAHLRLSPCFLPTSGKAERAESTRDSVVLPTLSRPLEQEVTIPTNVSESISKRVDQDEFEIFVHPTPD